MRITKREILFSVIIIAILVSFGVLISRSIVSDLSKNALEISEMSQAQDPQKFGYLKRTDVGPFLATGELKAYDPVSLPELPRKYSEIKKVKERYTEHIEVRTETDSKGHTRTWTETTYSWDSRGKEEFISRTWEFLGQRFSRSEVKFIYRPQRDTIIYEIPRTGIFNSYRVGDIRYVYYTSPISFSGLMIGKCEDKTYKDLRFENGGTIERKIKEAQDRLRNLPIVFWVFWSILVIGCVIGFYWLENEWLEDK